MKNKRILLLVALITLIITPARAQERIITRGIGVSTTGNIPNIGSMAPDFTATDKNMNDISLSSFRGKRVILNIFPSLDTPTCAISVRSFNEKAASLKNTVVLCISKDLPFAQTRFCSTEGIENVTPLSLFRSSNFDNRYGLIIKDGPLKGLTARAVIVINEDGKIIYNQIVRNVSEEPDYTKAIEALK